MTKVQDPPPPEPRSRLEDEVLEILQRADRPPSNVIKFRAQVRQRRPAVRDRARTITRNALEPVTLLGASLVLAILAVFAEGIANWLGVFLGLSALACFVLLFVLGFRRPRDVSQQRWRGRDIDLRPPTRWRR